MSTPKGAVFLDRDGTLNVDTRYVSRPEDVVLLPGAAAAVAFLNERGIPVVVVSNQSGIGRGFISPAAYRQVERTLAALLAEGGAHLDATYVCPHAPDQDRCECRKPGTLLFRRAAADLGLDLATSWYIGDRWRDVAPALELGGQGVLVPSNDTPADDLAQAHARARVARSLADAVRLATAALAPDGPR